MTRQVWNCAAVPLSFLSMMSHLDNYVPHFRMPTQIQTLNLGVSSHFRGYTYALATMLTTLALGFIVYGTSVWTMPSA